MKIIRQGFIIPAFLHPYFEDGIPEKTLIDWTNSQFNGITFLDIGAHVGTWSASLADNFERIIAFEPQLDVYNCLCGNIALNALSSKTTCHNVALSDSYGERALKYTIAGEGGASLVVNGNETERVQIQRLDSYKIKNVSLIKIDVEGAELDVLRGAVQTLIDSNFPPILFKSWNDERGQRKGELLDLFTELGYTVSSINCFPEMHLAKK